VLDTSPKSNNFPPGIRAGDVIANRYRLEEIIGRGGMGVVVAAKHLELDERVAVKFMSPDALSDPEAIARFDREVRAAARVKSEYVARVYDAGKLPDGRRYMVSEYLEGEDLSVRVQRDGPLETELAIRFILQASSAVHEAHRLGIVHRDLKPANLRVVKRADGSEVIKVLDFGVMKRMPDPQSETEPHETQPGTIVGTPLYTSPEQLRGSAGVDARTDIWSLGTTLFELLGGRPPFGGSTYPQVIANVLESPPKSLRVLRPEISEELERVVLRCLEKQPDARYPGIIDFAQALAETIELDSEQRALLERMLRNPKVPLLVSPVGHETTKHSEPDHAIPITRLTPAATSTPIGTNEYQDATLERRRLYWTSGAALITALLVIALGLPLLPRFDRRIARPRIAAEPSSTVPKAQPNAPASQTVLSPHAMETTGEAIAAKADLPQPPFPGKALATPPLRRPPRQRDSAVPSASAPISDSAAVPPPPKSDIPAPRKNPLLVHPR